VQTLNSYIQKGMDIEFDSAKDKANIEKHGVSLARAVDMEDAVILEDSRRIMASAVSAPSASSTGRRTASPSQSGTARPASSVFAARTRRRCGTMAAKKKPVVFDDDNPEWTKEDFARAKPASAFPEITAAFPKIGRPRKAEGEKKVAVSLRLSPDVLDHFRNQGAGWQTRIDEELKRAVVRQGRSKAERRKA
jgi:uncharacterized protein (DUF4415 family)